MPTASSAQMTRRITSIIMIKVIRTGVFFTFFITRSSIRPVPSSKTPATIKSDKVQFTSPVNCIAINGISNRNATMSTIMTSLLLSIIINVFINSRFNAELTIIKCSIKKRPQNITFCSRF